MPAAREGRVGHEHVDVAGLGQQAVDVRASARSAATARPPVSAASGSSTSARRPVSDEHGAARGHGPGDRRAQAAGRAGDEHGPAAQLHQAREPTGRRRRSP